MKEKNKKLTIIVSCLLLVIGVSFAYFVATSIYSGEGASTNGTTATISSSELKVEGNITFNDLDIYPGHQNVSSIKVTATGENELIPYNVIWEGNNSLNTPLNYTVYKTTSEIEVSATCEQTREIIEGSFRYYEECSISNLEQLGTSISTGVINTNETRVTLVPNEFITSTNTGEIVYYYVILEYPNLEENQNSDIGGSFNGEITIEENEVTSDITIANIYIENNGEYVESTSIPNDGYTLNTETSTCNNNANIGYDSENNRIYVSNLNTSGTECTLYYDEYNQTATETIEDLYENNQDTLAYDDYGNLRYIGANPNNYVLFNGELWRIIGIFSEDTHGIDGEKLIKIIRSEALGDITWDETNNNDWEIASLQTTLNGDYLNGSGSYTSTGIKSDTARNMIETVTWKLGGTANYSSVSNGLASHFYNYERGTTVYSGNATTWSGKVALMYPSDYGYATSGGTTANRKTCLAKELYNWDTESDCKNNDWLYDSNTIQWTLTSDSSISFGVFYVHNTGYVTRYNASYVIGARPSVYLTSNVKISGGDGSSSNPYTLSVV